MIKYRKISTSRQKLNTTEEFNGEAIEQKIRRTLECGAPIEAISPMLYTERKEGVRADTNIRTDKWDVAQQAMTTIADGMRTKRAERMNATADKPDTNS